VDRIGQKHDTIFAYSFLPADGVDRIIHLRTRLFHRLQQNQEVVGTDESFFGEDAANKLRDLYTEKAGTLDDDKSDEDIDLASLALQVFNSASADDQKAAQALPPVVGTARAQPDGVDLAQNPPGAIAYLRFPDADALVRVDDHGNLISQSLSAIFRAAACAPDTPALAKPDNHHDLVARCVQIAAEEQTTFSGHFGSLRSVRRKLWDRLSRYRTVLKSNPDLLTPQLLAQLEPVFDIIWRHNLKTTARDAISRQIRLGISDSALAEMVVRLAADDRLCEITDQEEAQRQEPKLICSLGLLSPAPTERSSNP
jgi:hypothetical protein